MSSTALSMLSLGVPGVKPLLSSSPKELTKTGIELFAVSGGTVHPSESRGQGQAWEREADANIAPASNASAGLMGLSSVELTPR
jgi:hypothetical protein